MVEPLHPNDFTALIVEDDRNDAAIVARALNTFGIKKCQTVDTAEDALAFLADHTRDIALIDYRLPGMNGLQLLERIRESYPEILAILVTGARDENVAVSAIKLGAADYVAKDDLLTGHLVRSLQAALRERMASREGERREALSLVADRIEMANTEVEWLLESFSCASDLRGYPLCGPVATEYGAEGWGDVLDAFSWYLLECFVRFPEPLAKQEEDLVRMFIKRSSSPREVMMVYRAALRSLSSDPAMTGVEPPLNPTVLLVRILARLVEEYQGQLSLGASN